MIFNSIRWRLQAWHGTLLVLVLAGFGFTAYHVAWDNLLRRIDAELDQRFFALFRPQPHEPPPGPPPSDQSRPDRRFDPAQVQMRMTRAIEQTGSLESSQTNTVYYVLWMADGSVMARSPSAPAQIPLPQPGPSRDQRPPGESSPVPHPGPPMPKARMREHFRETFHFLPHGECVLVGRNVSAEFASMRRLAAWLCAAGAAVLVAGLAGGWWLASRAIQPIEDISATAVKIAAGDLSQRINTTGTENELGRLANVLNSTFARLEAAFAHQARFTSDASHELRTPVSVILTQAQGALARERSPAEYREALEACQRAAHRMRKLTESLLALARLDAGEENFKREAFDLARIASECVELVRPLASEKNLSLSCEPSPAICKGDPERIGQVVTNLLSNAIHFNRPMGFIKVVVRAQDGSALLEVADAGSGIPAEDLPHIFERFYRVDKARSRVQGSTGLGLAISKAIVDAHGGELTATSRIGEGSTFTVKLPLG